MSILIISVIMMTSFSLPAHATPEKWTTQPISNNVIGPSCIALDSNNYPHIAYTEWEPPVNSDYVSRNGKDDVIYTSWNGAKWINQTVASDAAVDDLALDSLGNAHILYKTLDGTEDLMYAYWTGHNWSIQTVDDQAISGGSLALDSLGNPHTAYFTHGNATSPFFLKYAVWSGTSWNNQILDMGSLTYQPSIKLDKQNNPHLMYETDIVISTNSSNNSKETLMYATTKNGAVWSIQTVGNDIWYTNFELDANGNPHFSYSSNGLVYASWNGQFWNMERINVTAQSDNYLALDKNGSPHIAFANGTLVENGSYAAFNGTAWEIQAVTSNVAGVGPIAIDLNGNAHLLFYGPSSGYPPLKTLMYATNAVSSQTSTGPLFTAVLIVVPVSIFFLIITIIYDRKKKRQLE